MNLLQCGSTPRATRADARRAHLIDVARKLFTERGFHATGVAQIAAASGIKVGQIYRDFQSKEDIVAAIVEVDLANFLDEDALATAIAHHDSAAVLAWIERFVLLDEPIEECRMMTEIAAEAARNARIAEVHRSVDRKARGSLTVALATLAPGDDRAPQRTRLTDLIMTLGIGLINRRLADPDLDIAALTERIGHIIAREIQDLTGGD